MKRRQRRSRPPTTHQPRVRRATWFALVAVVGAVGVAYVSTKPQSSGSGAPSNRGAGWHLSCTGYDVVHAYPHDAEAFTQGLIFRDGFLYESTGHATAIDACVKVEARDWRASSSSARCRRDGTSPKG